MSADVELIKKKLAENYLTLLSSKRGMASSIAKTIGKPSSYIGEIKRGKPVNAIHLVAVAKALGVDEMLKIMSVDVNGEAQLALPERTEELATMLAEIEINSPDALAAVEQYINGVYAGAKAGAKAWKKLEQAKIHVVNDK